jgi:hypothetical protein
MRGVRDVRGAGRADGANGARRRPWGRDISRWQCWWRISELVCRFDSGGPLLRALGAPGTRIGPFSCGSGSMRSYAARRHAQHSSAPRRCKMHVIAPVAARCAGLVRALVDHATHCTSVLLPEWTASVPEYGYAAVRRHHGIVSKMWNILAASNLVQVQPHLPFFSSSMHSKCVLCLNHCSTVPQLAAHGQVGPVPSS